MGISTVYYQKGGVLMLKKNTIIKNLLMGLFALVITFSFSAPVEANVKVNKKIQSASDKKVISLDKYAKAHGWSVNYYDLKRKKNYLKVKFEFENDDYTCEVSQITKYKKVKSGKKTKKIVVTHYYQEGVKVSLLSIKKVLRE